MRRARAAIALAALCACTSVADPNERADVPGADRRDAAAPDAPAAPDTSDAPAALDRTAPGDAPVTDARPPTGEGACAPMAVVDFTCPPDARFNRASDMRATLSNALAPRDTAFRPSCRGQVLHPVAVRYRACHRAYLEVSTLGGRTTAGLDTVVWVATGCDPDATEIACNDDEVGVTSRALTRRPVEAGEVVYIFAATAGGSGAPTGTIDLSVVEVPPDPYGPCVPRPGGGGAACPAGTSCSDDPGPARCVPHGAPGGLCGASANGTTCPPPSRCEGGTPWRCSVPTSPSGLEGTPCGFAAPFCAGAGLGCTGSPAFYTPDRYWARRRPFCAPLLRHGEPCSPISEARACPPGDACIAGGGNEWAGACLQAYTATAMPAVEFIDACDPATGGRDLGRPDPSLGGPRDACARDAALVPFPFQLFDRSLVDARAPPGGWWLLPCDSGFAFAGFPSFYDYDTGGRVTDSDGPLVWGLRIPERDIERPPFLAPLASGGIDIGAGRQCARVLGSSPRRRLVLSWVDHIHEATSKSTVSFQIILEEGTNAIEFRYGSRAPTVGTDVARVDGTEATIGLQASIGQYAFHQGPVAPMSGIRWEPVRPPR